MGDGTPSDVFFGKDRHLMALVETVERENAVLVIGGDAMDFQQAWTFTRILRAHQDLLSALSRLSRSGRLYYLVGNHDYDLSFYRELLNFNVCDELVIGDRILVQHGFQYDPFMKSDLEGTAWSTQIHHLLERYLNTWLRIPLFEFYTLGNRVLFWLVHKMALAWWLLTATARLLGFPASHEQAMQQLDFWARSNMGDPMCIFKPIMRRLDTDDFDYIVCGHSHLPGIVRAADRAYVNTGSWTFASSHYVIWDGEDFSCHDWITGREFTDQLYKPLLDGTIDEKDFWQWWRENYMGWLRFREGEERRGRLVGWESYIRDYQHMARVKPSLHRRGTVPPPLLPRTEPEGAEEAQEVERELVPPSK